MISTLQLTNDWMHDCDRKPEGKISHLMNHNVNYEPMAFHNDVRQDKLNCDSKC